MEESNIKVVVFGAGYVGMSMSTLLSQRNEVVVYDIDVEKVEKINSYTSTVEDKDISSFLSSKKLNLRATSSCDADLKNADFVLICTPTDFNEETQFFDTKSVEQSIQKVIKINNSASIIIKSTVPIGFTENQRSIHKNKKIFYSPEFLREGSALYDNLNPSRVIIGGENSIDIQKYVDALNECAVSKEYKTLYMSSTEAESVKLFSNTYLAMRVAFFNELDNFAIAKNLNTKMIIDGMSLDPRIGDFYNNPSFGYGGYCLPKDTKQLVSNYKGIKQTLINAIVESNNIRKLFLAETIKKSNFKRLGIYKLAMKEGSDNYRQSAIIDIINLLKKDLENIFIFEPMIQQDKIFNCKVMNCLEEFKSSCDVILTNRMQEELEDVSYKVFTRDIYNNN